MAEEPIEAEIMDEGGTITSSALESITRGEIDMQVATAKRYPRNLAKFKANAIVAVTSSQEIAESCNYYLERKDGKTGEKKAIEGASIRLAEICMSFFGNTRWAGRVIGEDDKYVYAQGVAHDVENNNFRSEEVPRKIVGSSGKRFSADMVAVTGAAAKAIAMRNAAFRVIPRSYIEEIRLKAKQFAQGDARSVVERWGKAAKFFLSVGVTEAQLLAKLEVESVEKLTPEDIGKLNGIRTSMKDGMTSIAEQFPSATPPAEGEDATKLEDAPASPTGDANTDKVADEIKPTKKEAKAPQRAKKAEKEPAAAASGQAEQDPAVIMRGDLISRLHEKLTSIFGGDQAVIDSAVSEASKEAFPNWSTFAMRATPEQVQHFFARCTDFASFLPGSAAAGGEATQQTITQPTEENWVARVMRSLSKDEDRATWVLRVLKGAEILSLDEKRLCEEISRAIELPVTSANALNGLNVEALKKVHKRLVDVGNET